MGFGREIPLPPLESCKHQFFEVRDIGYSPMGTETFGGKEQLVVYPYKGGKLVMCALCGEQRQLWNTGELLISIDGAWVKL
jgi:hypothetical protein